MSSIDLSPLAILAIGFFSLLAAVIILASLASADNRWMDYHHKAYEEDWTLKARKEDR